MFSCHSVLEEFQLEARAPTADIKFWTDTCKDGIRKTLLSYFNFIATATPTQGIRPEPKDEPKVVLGAPNTRHGDQILRSSTQLDSLS